MAHKIVMPKLGETMEEGTIALWRVREGDSVRKGDILMDVETDKATLEAESFVDGTVLEILVAAGGKVPVGTTVAYLGQPGKELPSSEEVGNVRHHQATTPGSGQAGAGARRRAGTHDDPDHFRRPSDWGRRLRRPFLGRRP